MNSMSTVIITFVFLTYALLPILIYFFIRMIVKAMKHKRARYLMERGYMPITWDSSGIPTYLSNDKKIVTPWQMKKIKNGME